MATEIVTKDELEAMFSRQNRKIEVTDEAINLILESINDSEFDGFKFKENMITYQSVLDGRGSLIDYINAIKFCSYLDVNEGNYTDAYIKTFFNRDFIQDRYQFPKDTPEYKQITSAAARYRKTKMVVGIMTQCQIPFHILFQGYREKAMNRLVYEMDNARLAKDRIAAAKVVIESSAPPENYQIDINLKSNEDNVVDRYEKAMQRMVEEQYELISKGADIKQITNSKIVEAEVVNE